MPHPEDAVGTDVSSTHPLRARWIVDVARWRPTEREFDFILNELLPEHESLAVRRFHREDDRKRACVSRLMQRAIALRACALSIGARGTAMRDVDIRRTKGAKPFHATVLEVTGAPNFNFNVSHEGDYVVLASETHAVVGVDVAAPGQVRRIGGLERDVGRLLETFSSVLTDRERERISATASTNGERAGEELFRKHWSLKESHVKAIGVGLGMDLKRCEFDIDAATSTASVAVDGVTRSDWAFHIEGFPPVVDGATTEETHWITVSRGPYEDIVDAHGEFTTVFSQRSFSEDAWRDVLAAPAPKWELMTVGDLIPDQFRDAFESHGGVIF
ncbi:4'-phosphopantetheinyl transferase superfamily [Ostreococcus tauri]|uniref:holo-[acyl-carrier-protein] synthase n=1 Tax=Ostreococcus tauri TaxID=70448 RepID=Q013L5_OSTTA|nr:4'-phosphopantetheinyl transferase superfamily [Ostreococcus tauri]CAL54914.1 4'-phosphopantetheinyl transferase superfamily [Ostreococcus tauri]|eukprot:XP_003080746.1 4'-phosphopantetheinyl transferase superfamily [Ostreococcus tauri]